MKSLLPILAISFKMLLVLQVQAQSDSSMAFKDIPDSQSYKNVYVRLFNDREKVAGQGYLLPGSDATIEIKHGRKIKPFEVAGISLIKTHRSAGYSTLIGTSIGVAFGAIGLAIAGSKSTTETTSHSFSPGPGLGIALVSVAVIPLGTLTGFIVGHSRKRKTFSIQSNPEKWKAARREILHLP
jgi:hypothetical protein